MSSRGRTRDSEAGDGRRDKLKTYISWNVVAVSGEYLDTVVLSVDTAKQIKYAERALREAGLSGADVYAGEGEDSVRTGHRVFGDASSTRDASRGQVVEAR
jgi:hypothetical protein